MRGGNKRVRGGNKHVRGGNKHVRGGNTAQLPPCCPLPDTHQFTPGSAAIPNVPE